MLFLVKNCGILVFVLSNVCSVMCLFSVILCELPEHGHVQVQWPTTVEVSVS